MNWRTTGIGSLRQTRCASRASSKAKKPMSCQGRGETSGRRMGMEDMAQLDPFRAIQ
jgi:hypothetical protein